MISHQNRFFGRRNNLSPYISFWRVAMFAPWRSQKSLRKHKDPVTANSSRDGRLFPNHTRRQKKTIIDFGQKQVKRHFNLLLVIPTDEVFYKAFREAGVRSRKTNGEMCYDERR